MSLPTNNKKKVTAILKTRQAQTPVLNLLRLILSPVVQNKRLDQPVQTGEADLFVKCVLYMHLFK